MDNAQRNLRRGVHPERFCRKCRRELSPNNPGKICTLCQEKMILDTVDLYYSVQNMMPLLGLDSEEQVRRLGREGKIPGRVPVIKSHLYVKEIVDAWIRSDHTRIRKPGNPLQQEAYGMCQKGHHEWMKDERFLDQACTENTRTEIGDGVLHMYRTYKCYFCEYELTVPFPQ